MRRFLRPPSISTAIALLALAVATTGTAVAATGQIVHITDGTDAARIAHVDAAGKLLVGDGSGSLTVDGRLSPGLPIPFTTTVISSAITSSNNACTTPDFVFPAGVIVFIERAVVEFQGARASESPRASVRFFQKIGGVQTPRAFAIPTTVENGFGNANGSTEIGLLVRQSTLADAAEGAFYGAEICVNRGSAASGATANGLLTGRR